MSSHSKTDDDDIARGPEPVAVGGASLPHPITGRAAPQQTAVYIYIYIPLPLDSPRPLIHRRSIPRQTGLAKRKRPYETASSDEMVGLQSAEDFGGRFEPNELAPGKMPRSQSRRLFVGFPTDCCGEWSVASPCRDLDYQADKTPLQTPQFPACQIVAALQDLPWMILLFLS